jgi:uncharacterized protein YuzE
MTFEYHRESDMLYIRLVPGTSAESEEVSPGVVLDYDAHNQVVGIEIEDASRKIDLTRLEINALPLVKLVLHQNESAMA